MKIEDAEEVVAGMEELGQGLAVALGLDEDDRYAVLRLLAPIFEESFAQAESPEARAANFWRAGRLTSASLPSFRPAIRDLWRFLQGAGVTVTALANLPPTPAFATAFRSSRIPLASDEASLSEAESLQVLRTASFVAWAIERPAISDSEVVAEGKRRQLVPEEIERVQAALRG